MGVGTLTTRSNTIIDASWWNDIIAALKGDLVPRSASTGAASDEAGDLGTADFSWRNAYISNLVLDGSPLDASLLAGKPHRIRSGKAKTSGYPDFLSAAGSGNGLSATLDGTTTAFSLVVNGTNVSVTANLSFLGLTAAPSSDNTCAINDSTLAGAASSKLLGEYGSEGIKIDTIGTEISDLDGTIAAFLTGTEVFLALVDTTNNKLYPIYRGWAGTDRAALTNDDTITLLKLNTLLVKSDGIAKVASTYYPETVSELPAVGNTGKVYYDRSTNKFAYDDGTEVNLNYMVVGFAVCDDSDCLYVQPFDFDKGWSEQAQVTLMRKSSTAVTVVAQSAASVAGQDVVFFYDVDMTQADNMDTDESIAASTAFFVYLKSDGSLVFSSIAPRPYSYLLRGFYHPTEYYRCIGAVLTDSSSNFVAGELTFGDPKAGESTHFISTGSSDVTFALGSAKLHRHKSVFIKKTDSGSGKIVVNALTSETMDGESSLNLRSQYDFLHVISDGTNWYVKDYLCSYAHSTTIAFLYSSAPSVVLYFKRRAGRVVDVFLKQGTTAGSKNGINDPAINDVFPSDFRPTGSKRVPWVVIYNGAYGGFAKIGENGALSWSHESSGWSAVTTSIEACGGTYLLDGVADPS